MPPNITKQQHHQNFISICKLMSSAKTCSHCGLTEAGWYYQHNSPHLTESEGFSFPALCHHFLDNGGPIRPFKPVTHYVEGYVNGDLHLPFHNGDDVPYMCPDCGIGAHLEFDLAVGDELTTSSFSADGPDPLWVGPLSASCIWLDEELTEMQTAIFSHKAADAVDAVFDTLGILVNTLLWIQQEFGSRTLSMFHDSYVWAQERRGRSTHIPHHMLIASMVSSLHTMQFTDDAPVMGRSLLEGAMSKAKRRSMLMHFYAGYSNYLAIRDGE